LIEKIITSVCSAVVELLKPNRKNNKNTENELVIHVAREK